MYAKTVLNGKEVMTMIDAGATDNFVAEREVQKLGLSLVLHSSHIKAMNLGS